MSHRERRVDIAPHLWDALEVMGRDMAVAPSALANQAVFAWLRINGYLVPGTAGQAVAATPVEPPAAARADAPTVASAPVAQPSGVAAVPTRAQPPPVAGPPPSTVAARPALVSDPQARPTAPEPVPGPAATPSLAPAPVSEALAAVAARIADIDADLLRFAKPRPPFPEEAEAGDEDDDDADDDGDLPSDADDEVAPAADEDDDLPAAEDDDAARAAADEEDAQEDAGFPDDAEADEPPAEGTLVVRSVPVVLYIEREGEETVRVEHERFIIGRGPTCDLIIDSPRVSREHVCLSRQGARFLIEDLGSSNGTWLGDDRLEAAREVESGEEYRLGNELVRLILRGE